MKTIETKNLEKALEENASKKREYGCTEVTIGFARDGHGDEIVDFMSMDSKGTFKCYELKVSLSDLRSENKLSWYGDYNYLVISHNLYMQIDDFDQYLPPFVGVMVGEELQLVRNAKHKQINDQTRNMLKDSLLRSVYWKMVKYQSTSELDTITSLNKQIQSLQEELDIEKQTNDRMKFVVNEYETYYRINHNDPSFTLDKGALQERLSANQSKGD